MNLHFKVIRKKTHKMKDTSLFPQLFYPQCPLQMCQPIGLKCLVKALKPKSYMMLRNVPFGNLNLGSPKEKPKQMSCIAKNNGDYHLFTKSCTVEGYLGPLNLRSQDISTFLPLSHVKTNI